MNPASVARLWQNKAAASVFSAELTNGPHLTLHPMKEGGGFVWVLWRPDVSIAQAPAEACIADGGRCRSRTKAAAIVEAVRRLTRARESADV
jgi:hypothetical protein